MRFICGWSSRLWAARTGQSGMQTLIGTPRVADLLDRSWRQCLGINASSTSSSSSDYSNQSRGGLPRFYSHVLPSSKASIIISLSLSIYLSIYLSLNANYRAILFVFAIAYFGRIVGRDVWISMEILKCSSFHSCGFWEHWSIYEASNVSYNRFTPNLMYYLFPPIRKYCVRWGYRVGW